MDRNPRPLSHSAVSLAGLLVAAGACGSAHAQAPGQDQRRFSGEASVSAEYQSNSVGASNRVATVKGLDKQDVIYRPQLVLQYSSKLAGQGFFLRGTAAYEFHQKNTELDTPRTNIEGGLTNTLPLGPCLGGFDLGFAARPSETSQLPLTVVKNVEKDARLGAHVICGGQGPISGRVGVQQSFLRNSRDDIFTDSDTTSVFADIGYGNAVIGRVALTGAYANSDSDPPTPASLLSPSRGFENYTVGISYTRPISARLTGSMAVDYNHVVPKSSTVDSSDAFGGQAALDYEPNSRARGTLSYRRHIEPAIQLGSAYTTTDELSLTGSYDLGSRITASAGVQWDRRHERVDPAALVVVGATRSHGYAVFASAQWRVGRRLYLGSTVRHEDRNAMLTDFDYQNTTVSLQASQRF